MITRCYAGPLEVREDGRTVDVLAVPFDTPTRVGGYVERFTRGAFPDVISTPGTVKLLQGHNHAGMPLGRATSAEEAPDGLRMTFHVSQTRAGDEALTLIRDGALSAVSIGFKAVPGGERWNTTRTEVIRTRAQLLEVSLVAVGAYPDAQVLAVREEPVHPYRLTLARWR